jgi:hypothetical protein
MVVLLAAVRWSLRYLWFTNSGGDRNNPQELLSNGLNEDLVASAVRGDFWRRVQGLATDTRSRDSELFSQLGAGFPRQGRMTAFPDMFWTFVERRASTTEADSVFALNLARSILAIGAVVTSRPGEGLDRFADRFESMGLVRDASIQVAKSRAVEWSLEHWATNEVVGAEFRKTIVKATVTGFRSDLRSSINAHLLGFERFVEGDSRPRALSVPIGFCRMPTASRCAGAGGYREIEHVTAGCAAIAAVSGPDPEAFSKATSSMDVAGAEIGSANWPFIVGASLLRRYGVPLIFTMHAGESFLTPFNGVRRLGELFLGEEPPARIGHALALSASAAERVCRGESPSLRRVDVIMDLCWALNANVGHADRVKDLLYRVVSPVGGAQPISVDAWVEASRLHNTVEGRVEVGLLRRNSDR